jgi:hypothetical protein
LLLRAEGLGLLIAASCAYAKLDGRWGWFAALFLVPDLSMLGYLLGPRFGALCYNSTHSTLGALSLAGIGFAVGSLMMMLGACIWLAHIGFDRMLGYGLKYASAFQDTHLGRALRGRPAVAEGRDGDALASRAKATA